MKVNDIPFTFWNDKWTALNFFKITQTTSFFSSFVLSFFSSLPSHSSTLSRYSFPDRASNPLPIEVLIARSRSVCDPFFFFFFAGCVQIWFLLFMIPNFRFLQSEDAEILSFFVIFSVFFRCLSWWLCAQLSYLLFWGPVNLMCGCLCAFVWLFWK